MNRLDEPTTKIVGTMLGISILCLLQIVTLEKYDAHLENASIIFAAQVPALAMLWHLWTNEESRWPRIEAIVCGGILVASFLSTGLGLWFFLFHIGSKPAAAFAISFVVCVMLCGLLQPPDKPTKPKG